jgi:osmoprotectant transport system permease protein
MTWFLGNLGVIADRTVAHVLLAVPPILLSLLLAIPFGWAMNHARRLRPVLRSAAALLYAIPSLPLFVALPLLIGTGLRDPLNIVVALTLYGLALMVPSTADALDGVDRRVLDAADSLGYGPFRRFLTVDLLLAGPALLAGLRVVAASTISLVTVGAVLGVPSLGLLFTDGFQRGILAEVVTGLLLTVLLALVADRLIVAGGRLALPWTRAAASRAVLDQEVIA